MNKQQKNNFKTPGRYQDNRMYENEVMGQRPLNSEMFSAAASDLIITDQTSDVMLGKSPSNLPDKYLQGEEINNNKMDSQSNPYLKPQQYNKNN